MSFQFGVICASLLALANALTTIGDFCGDEKCDLKCKSGEKCVEDDSIQCVQAPCCPRWSCIAGDPCFGKSCGAICKASLGDGELQLAVMKYCQPDGSCGMNAKPDCKETLKAEGENCGYCFCPPTYNAGTCEPGLSCVHNPQIPDLPGTCKKTDCTACEAMEQGQKCGQDGGPFLKNCTQCCQDSPTASSSCAEWRCDAGGWLCQKKCQTEEAGCKDVKGCKKAFGNGEMGMCIPTNKEGWNLEKDIDFSAPMKTGLCKSSDDTGCCGCFKQKMDKCEDKRCVPIPKKKIHRECFKKGEDVKPNMFNTGKMCAKRKDCNCFQNCKTPKKCKKAGGECLGSAPEWPHKVAGPCDKRKKCNCYIKTKPSIPILQNVEG